MSTNNAINYRPINWLFFASIDTPDQTGDGSGVSPYFDTAKFSTGGATVIGHELLVNITGYYMLNAQVTFGDVGAHTQASISILNTTTGERSTPCECNPSILKDSANKFMLNTQAVFHLNADDSIGVTCVVSGGTKTVDLLCGTAAEPLTWFSGSILI